MPSTLDQLRDEFDRWAHQGRGEKMEQGHHAVTEIIVARMGLKRESRVLDLGCGIGWATRLLAKRVPNGAAVGLDVSEEMIRRAREHGADPPNANFRVLRTERFPFQDGVFTHCLSIESLYYHPDITASLREVHRVLAPGGAAYLMVSFFKENPPRTADRPDQVRHLLGGDERGEGPRRRASPVPVGDGAGSDAGPGALDPVHYESKEAMQASLAIGALLVTAKR
jgi:SAM-dependent methyltransferase